MLGAGVESPNPAQIFPTRCNPVFPDFQLLLVLFSSFHRCFLVVLMFYRCFFSVLGGVSQFSLGFSVLFPRSSRAKRASWPQAGSSTATAPPGVGRSGASLKLRKSSLFGIAKRSFSKSCGPLSKSIGWQSGRMDSLGPGNCIDHMLTSTK